MGHASLGARLVACCSQFENDCPESARNENRKSKQNCPLQGKEGLDHQGTPSTTFSHACFRPPSSSPNLLSSPSGVDDTPPRCRLPLYEFGTAAEPWCAPLSVVVLVHPHPAAHPSYRSFCPGTFANLSCLPSPSVFSTPGDSVAPDTPR